MKRLLLTFVLFGGLSGAPAFAQGSVQTLPPAGGDATEGLLAPGNSATDVLTPGNSSDAVVTPPAPPAPPPPCGTKPITIAKMAWPSASLLAEIDARILKASFGCDVRVVAGDLAQTGASMGNSGEPQIAPEVWIDRIADIWNNAMKGEEVRQAGLSYDDTIFEGWFIPDYTAAQWPDALTVDGLKAHAQAFGNGKPRGRFISCPADWACALVNRNLLKALGLDQSFDIVEPANRFEMDTLIAEAVSRKQPLLFYYWQPNAVLSQFSFRQVTLPPYNHDAYQCLGKTACPTPAPTGFAPDTVVAAIAERVYLEAPQVAAFFQRAHMPLSEMNRMLLALGEPGATPEAVADKFVAERGDVWRPWLGPMIQVQGQQ